jgi:hypothetical protein
MLTNNQDFLHFMRQMNGVVRDSPDADDAICSKPICISSPAMIVLSAEFEALFTGKELLCPQSFNPGPIKSISTKLQDIDKQIVLCLADQILWVSSQN